VTVFGFTVLNITHLLFAGLSGEKFWISLWHWLRYRQDGTVVLDLKYRQDC